MVVLVLVGKRRRSLTLRYGILTLAPDRVTLADRDGDLHFDVAPAELRIEQAGRTRVALIPPEGPTWFITGLSAQQAGFKRVQPLIERYGAVASPPRLVELTDRRWGQMTTNDNILTSGFDTLAQEMIWQPVLIRALEMVGAHLA